ncbi:hypothetical protein PTKIN_Ptkin02bG0253300 [Pterospermum kingtungense]
MSNAREQSQNQSQSQKNATLEGLPLESSPYAKYKDLEDYKRNAYGTEGQLEVREKQGASGSTDAATMSDAKRIIAANASTH